MRIRVLVAEDHETVRQGLKLLIGGQPDMEVVAEAGDGAAAVERVEALAPDVAVLDIAMPSMNGLIAARHIRDHSPKTAVVALTRHTDPAYVKELMAAGASGYVLKQSPSGELLKAIRAAARGGQHLDAGLATRSPARVLSRRGDQSGPLITERERQVLQLMALGHSNKDIANELDVAVKTVEVHKSNAMRKLGLSGRIDVIRYASLQGWLREP
ncbi:MAG TPA: response regulator transcription factor [Vicinamibacterales bacterium]|nr:response regulator transcription factor [Vicinamibacterales bacterium]